MVVVMLNLRAFPFLFGGTFIEAHSTNLRHDLDEVFPFLFGGTFIEAASLSPNTVSAAGDFPSFSEGLSLRQDEDPD